MKRACRLCSASYDHFASITPQGSSGRILSASRTVLKTHREYYIMYKEELQAPIFYNSVKSLRKLEQTGSVTVSGALFGLTRESNGSFLFMVVK